MYPVINKEKGSDVAMRFVNGLCSEGFGEITYNDETKQRCFKRFHPEDENKLATGGTDGLINVFDVSQATEDDALITSMNTESSIQTLIWYKVS